MEAQLQKQRKLTSRQYDLKCHSITDVEVVLTCNAL